MGSFSSISAYVRAPSYWIKSRQSMKQFLLNTWKSHSRIDWESGSGPCEVADGTHNIGHGKRDLSTWKVLNSTLDERHQCEVKIWLWNESRQTENLDLEQRQVISREIHVTGQSPGHSLQESKFESFQSSVYRFLAFWLRSSVFLSSSQGNWTFLYRPIIWEQSMTIDLGACLRKSFCIPLLFPS